MSVDWYRINGYSDYLIVLLCLTRQVVGYVDIAEDRRIINFLVTQMIPNVLKIRTQKDVLSSAIRIGDITLNRVVALVNSFKVHSCL